MARAADKHGTDKVMVCSFTKAAATEIGNREIPIAKKMYGTLHSICWRTLETPEIAETKASEFNEQYPEYSITKTGKQGLDDGLDQPSFSNRGDELLAMLQLNRARMIPEEAWPERVRRFNNVWSEWKERSDYYDFTDLIETAVRRIIHPPHGPNVIFIDEAQDLSKLQFNLVRQWAEHTEFTVMVGDDDQCIYTFSGADARNLIGSDLPDENKIVLSRSYRLPRRIHARCQSWIEKCSQRQPKEFQPTDEEGEIVELKHGDWKHPEPIIDDITERLADNETCMILGACGYMLPPTIAMLREAGIVFHNPYRVTRADWNPLRQGEGSVSARISAFLNCGEDGLFPRWTAHQFNLWIDLIDAKKLLKHGAKKAIKHYATEKPGQVWLQDDWMEFFKTDPFGFDPVNIGWLMRNVRDAKQKSIAYPAAILKQHGRFPQPKVIVGTIHSVKGGEADNVYLFPDVSNQGYAEWRAVGERRDSVVRAFYVGLSRARKRVILPQPVGGVSVPLRGT